MPLPTITSCMIRSAQRQIVSFALIVKCVDRNSKTGVPVYCYVKLIVHNISV